MYMDYIQFHNAQSIENTQVSMLQDLEQLFCKSQSLLSKFGFPTPRRVPTEVEEAILKWCNEDVCVSGLRLGMGYCNARDTNL
jgi:hypothetical protein